MAKRTKTQEVKSFGGVQKLGEVTEVDALNAPVKDVNYDLQSIETESKTKLEDDVGHGNPVIVRCFEFGMNPQAFLEVKPTKQQLFNHHIKGIETFLWKDGLKVITEVAPRILYDEKNLKYKIFVGAKPMRGHILREQPKTLSQIAHG